MAKKANDVYLPYMPLFIADLLEDEKVRPMSCLEFGAYMRLLFAAWTQKPVGTVPNDDHWLAEVARVTPLEWSRIKDRVMAPFKLKKRWRQKRMISVFSQSRRDILRIRETKRAAANVRWDKSRRGKALEGEIDNHDIDARDLHQQCQPEPEPETGNRNRNNNKNKKSLSGTGRCAGDSTHAGAGNHGSGPVLEMNQDPVPDSGKDWREADRIGGKLIGILRLRGNMAITDRRGLAGARARSNLSDFNKNILPAVMASGKIEWCIEQAAQVETAKKPIAAFKYRLKKAGVLK